MNARISERELGQDALMLGLLHAQLGASGLLDVVAAGVTVAEACEAARASGLPPIHERWFRHTLRLLCEQGRLHETGGRLHGTVPDGPAQAMAWQRWREQRAANAQDAASALVERMLEALPRILRGEQSPTELMFAGADAHAVEEVYRGSEVSSRSNARLAALVGGYAAARMRRDADMRLRLFEIGAGTGATTLDVWRALETHAGRVEEYVYTDLSRAFLQHAQGRAHPGYARFDIFDVEQPLAGQGFVAGAADIVIAANVLHATRDVRVAVRNAKALLKRNGLLILNELTGFTVFTHLTFGLLPGWWRFVDEDLREPGTPALSRDNWQRLLRDEGFPAVRFVEIAEGETPQVLIIAESDGRIRQPLKTNGAMPLEAAPVSPGPRTSNEAPDAPVEVQASGDMTLRRGALNALRRVVGEVLKIDPGRINPQQPLERYGIDSILVVKLANALAAGLGRIPSTTFFEYPTIDALVDELLRTRRDDLQRWLKPQDPPQTTPDPVVAPAPAQTVTLPARLMAQGTPTGLLPRAAGATTQAIAIIGVSGRYARSDDLEEFWDHLRQGKHCIGEIPADRWDWRAFQGEAGIYSRWGGFMKRIDCFDPLFFRIAPREAERMDPQERMFLQVAHASIENAGYRPAKLSDRRNVGVFVGVMNSTYGRQPAFWSIANRVSYVLDFEGPSLAVDTACSSSLTAIHLAVQSLRRGECDCAVAGGVHAIVDPVQYQALSSMRMLSRDERCRAFGAGADGFVDGEGVGAVVLKPLALAQRDGDFIHGVILGSHVNSGGHTHGYTVPNPQAQARVVERALKDAAIDARQVSYVEAHGTGTELGDPIEVAGLSRAFGNSAGSRCALGSVKSNIGHCESAAGIAGLSKILLQMRHGAIAPSLNSTVRNPHIEFASTPFFVPQELVAWQRERNDGIEQPRIAGLSSFGAGGANAHLVISDYANAPRDTPANARVMIVLSARDAERLGERVAQLLQALDRYGDADLASIAYTLQVGRDAMEMRLALVAGSLAELRDKLRRFQEGDSSIDELFSGEARRHQEALGLLSDDDAIAGVIDSWVANRHFGKLLDLWVNGLEVDWQRLYRDARPVRVPLPSYPFAAQRHWSTTRGAAAPTRLHPLVHRNESGVDGLRFVAQFDGTEFFFSHHRVAGRWVLPGVALLEMARAALQLATNSRTREGSTAPAMGISDMLWLRPLALAQGGGTEVEIRLNREADGRLSFEISSRPAVPQESTVHCRGYLAELQPMAVPPIDVAAIRAACQGEGRDTAALYAAFAAAGVDFGPAFRGLQSLHTGSGQWLARVCTPQAGRDEAFVLPPGLLDGVMQACMGGASFRERREPRLQLLFSMQEMRVLRQCPESVWAWVRESAGGTSAEANYDVDVLDGEGQTCVQFTGLRWREMEADRETRETAPDTQTGVLFVPRWEALTHLERHTPTDIGATFVVGGSEAQIAALREWRPQAEAVSLHELASAAAALERGVAQVFWIAPPPSGSDLEALLSAQAQSIGDCFALLRSLLDQGLGSRPLEFTAITFRSLPTGGDCVVDAAHSAVAGLLGSLAKEHPRWRVKHVDLEDPSAMHWPEVASLSPDPRGDGWAYRHGQWRRLALLRCELPAPRTAPFRRGGVFVIIGGAGGLGRVVSEYLVREHAAQLVWIGRRAPDDSIASAIAALAEQGPAPIYLQADAADPEALRLASLRIRERHAAVHGVIVSAVGPFDESLARTDAASFAAILTAKIDVSVRVAQVFGSEPLDFLLYFSSINSFVKDQGKAGYSAGCTFIDGFAQQLRARIACPVKVMHWGFWAGVGSAAAVPEVSMRRVQQAGIGSIEPAEGMAALEQLMAGPLDEIGFIKVRTAAWLDAPPWSRETLQVDPGCVALPVALEVPTRVFAGMETGASEAFAALELQLAGLLRLQLDTVSDPTANYRRWLEHSRRELRARGLDAAPGTAPDVAWRSWQESQGRWQQQAGLAGPARLVDATIRALPDILSGRTAATDVLFPRSSVRMVEGVYQGNALSEYFNDVLVDQVLAEISRRVRADGASRLRILEIGAGTGGTTAVLLSRLGALAAHVGEYNYTDLSRAFLQHAERTFSPQASFLRTGLFDVEESPATQQIECAAYDIVIAANVLHATRDIRTALRNAKATLKAGGLLLLNEIVGTSLVAHLTFGLLDGWWRYEDETLRVTGSPALDASTWRRVLQEEGFFDTRFPVPDGQALSQLVVGARSDGQRRLARPAEPRPIVSSPVPQRSESSAIAPPRTDDGSLSQRLLERTVERLRELVASAAKLAVHEVDAREPLERYGIDSILVVQITDALREVIPGVSNTLLFEHQSIDALASHLVRVERDALLRLTGLDVPAARRVAPGAAPTAVPAPATRAPAPQPVTRREVTPAATQKSRDIAIIGVVGRYPGARNLREFWSNLAEGRDCVTEIPADRWDLRHFYEPDPTRATELGKSYCKWGGFVEGCTEFDALFFNISPLEAQSMDPQERLFLESCWNLLEDAGYTRELLARRHGGRVGVFAGITKTGFELYGPQLWNSGQRAFPHTSFGSLANRVSYFLNLNGPSLPIDTMCSASLTAIHEACEHLLRDECELAIAGGVNLYLHPSNFLGLCANRMLSPAGRCKAFGAGGDGMVPGEGVGAVLLKPLDRAIADGDMIHAVIAGSSINHGGKTNGYTVPNPAAQASLVADALRKSGMDAGALSYVEAHGTGTELGDPIEIAGLTQAFGPAAERQYCAIGSVKSNIGHLEAASGIAGVTKVLLQLRHGSLVPSLHADELNPRIDFGASPFRLQNGFARWQGRPVMLADGRARELRVAGVSSFGAGGANAHVILREHLDVAGPDTGEPQMIVLSARDEPGLRERVRQLADALAGEAAPDSLARIAYTLQTGREPMAHRLAFQADTLPELREKLDQLARGASVTGCHRGEVGRARGAQAALAADEDMQQVIDSWLAKRKFGQVLDWWVNGFAVDWERVHGTHAPRRVSLPGYPFAREHHWLPGVATDPVTGKPLSLYSVGPIRVESVEPVAPSRAPDPSVVELTGSEFFLEAHRVDARRVLPAAAYLEMVRAAVVRRMPDQDAAGACLVVEDVAWHRPLVVDAQTASVQVRLLEIVGGFEFEIVAEVAGVQELHCTGRARREVRALSAPVDITAIEAATAQVVDVCRCYDTFAAMGITYGEAHRGIESLRVGETAEGDALVFARLRLPSVIASTRDDFGLHPALLDSALQACIAFAMNGRAGQTTVASGVPFALHELCIHGAIPAVAIVVAREAKDDAGRSLRTLDLDIADAQGVLVATLRGLASRPLVEGSRAEHGTLLLTRQWLACGDAVTSPGEAGTEIRSVMIADENRWQSLKGAVRLWPREARAGIPASEAVALELLDRLRALMNAPTPQHWQILVAHDAEGTAPLVALSALLRTAQQEYPGLLAQLLLVDPESSGRDVSGFLEAAAMHPGEPLLRWREGRLQRAALEELMAIDTTGAGPWREGGVYLITGGAGALGSALAREIAGAVRGVSLHLAGRSPPDGRIAALLADLETYGASAQYHAVDVADRDALASLIGRLREDNRGLHGIVHAAGTLRDGPLADKSDSAFSEVLRPKLHAAQALDDLTRDLGLDLFVLCSSAAASWGNTGQADYAFANACLTEFAQARNLRVARGECSGLTMSLELPWMELSGMESPQAMQARMRAAGMRPLPVREALRVLDCAWRSRQSRVVVLHGEPQRLRSFVRDRGAPAMRAPSAPDFAPHPGAVGGSADLHAITVARMRKLLAENLRLAPDRLDAQVPFEEYGIDSILALQLVGTLEKTFGRLPKTLFFEHQDIDTLAGYFESHHRDTLLALESPAPAPRTAAPANTARAATRPELVETRPTQTVIESTQRAIAGPLDVAIVGISGRYAQAENLAQFWENLVAGRDCITEIPPDRWDHSRYFDARRDIAGKTYSKWGGFLNGVDRFDPLFFNIAPLEALGMDPQERLFLECAFEAIEDAGHTRESLKQSRGPSTSGEVGVFVGVMYQEYQLYGAQAQALGQGYALGGTPASIANRVSYFGNFQGPSVAMDTMCSSSLTAIHYACKALMSGECIAAIAGGVNINIHPNKYLMLAQGQFASSKGRCESFGAHGDGYVPGEGVGAVVLKTLAHALADGDRVLGVIKATSINHGGKTNGYSVPNPLAQSTVVADALARAQVPACAINYIEAHGTGTSLGDPIEVSGLLRAFGPQAGEPGFCALGSVKSNIGHCESAAGIAGLTKVLLQMRHGTLVPSLHATELNPHIDFAGSPFRVQRELAHWQRVRQAGTDLELPRTAGISSFGAGGANAHVIVQEWMEPPAAPATAEQDAPAVVLLSARDARALAARASALLAALQGSLAELPLRAIAYTSQLGREHMEKRLAFLTHSRAELIKQLGAWLREVSGIDGVHVGDAKAGKSALGVLAADDVAAPLLDSWLREGRLDRLADVWCKGLKPDWERLYAGDTPRRVGLPVYPFARERHWVDNPAFQRSTPPADGLDALLDEFVDRRLDLDATAERLNELLNAPRA